MNNVAVNRMNDTQSVQLNELAHKVNRLGLNLLVFTPQMDCVLQSQTAALSDCRKIADVLGPAQQTAGCGCDWISPQLLACRVLEQGIPAFTAVIECPACEPLKDREKQMITCIAEDWAAQYNVGSKISRQIDKISFELSKAYEEIMLLYHLSTNMKVTQTSASYLQMACDQLTQLVHVEGIAIFVERKTEGQRQLALTAGSGVISIDQTHVDILQMYLAEELHNGRQALLDSDVDGPFKFAWPAQVRNIIAVPLGACDRMRGLLVATNIGNKADFDSVDVKLFNSVANQCMVFIENNQLFDDLKELFIGSLKALTSSIDAKDQYTRGHSERVAFISRWIGERLSQTQPVSEKELHHIYLAGLLHDIGKIGVSEPVLRKRGRLTDEERAMIQAHPRIGAAILSEIRQMDEIIPGVLSHHERLDGTGYPQRLCGDQIPLVARIISLADAFDAMTSKRVYREAMSIRRATTEIEKGIGTQFDERAARVFLDSDIEKLWKIIQDGYIESWDYSNFDEYGVNAVGALLR
ncbi:MAG: HD domain-containing protein [Planctomycetaceae bacterium]|nr:HD domain-containing protein [Planctomycetaceae bacterium]